MLDNNYEPKFLTTFFLKNFGLSIFRAQASKANVEQNVECRAYYFYIRCDGCDRKPLIGVRYKCKTCEDFDFCEHCFSNKTDHDHNFVAYHRTMKNRHPIEAGKPGRARTEWCHSSPDDKHMCIKEITVSSNEHMAARMINKEIDMPWISEKAFGAVSAWKIVNDILIHKNEDEVIEKLLYKKNNLCY